MKEDTQQLKNLVGHMRAMIPAISVWNVIGTKRVLTAMTHEFDYYLARLDIIDVTVERIRKLNNKKIELYREIQAMREEVGSED